MYVSYTISSINHIIIGLRSSIRSEHLAFNQRVAGSNPVGGNYSFFILGYHNIKK
jgi:hypothetical protein